LHGIFSDTGTLVFGSKSYQELIGRPEAQAFLQALSSLKTVIMVGVGKGTDDPTFINWFEWNRKYLANADVRIYKLVLEREVESTREALDDRDRVVVVPYGKQHEDLTRFLRSLATDASPRSLRVWAGIGLLTAAIAGTLTLSWFPPHWSIRVEGIVRNGPNEPAPHAVIRQADRELATADDRGFFVFYVTGGTPLENVAVQYDTNPPILFRLSDQPLVQATYIEFQLNTGTREIRQLK
jgi:hypothetical protein